jgi:hypothetical protein
MRSDYEGDHPLVIVRLANGNEQQVYASTPQLAKCAPGDTIALMQQGMSYRVAVEGCLSRD